MPTAVTVPHETANRCKRGSVVCEDPKENPESESGCSKYKRFGFWSNPVQRYAKLLGTFKFPDLPAGFDRTVWQVDGKAVAVKQSNRLGDARPPEFNLGKCAFPPGTHIEPI